MPELTSKERLQPSLLDRLTDDEPGVKQESRDKRVLSPARLRTSVLRDLSWLFNTTNLAVLHDLEPYPEVLRSVVNYGLPDLAGRTISSIDAGQLEEIVRQAILDFEPRLIPKSVEVRVVMAPPGDNNQSPRSDDKNKKHSSISLAVDAQLWSQPLPLRLHLQTEIDLADGDVRVVEVRDGDSSAKG